MRCCHSTFEVLDCTECVVAVGPKVIIKRHALLSFDRVAVNAAQKQVCPFVLECNVGGLRLDMLNCKVRFYPSLTIAAIVSKPS